MSRPKVTAGSGWLLARSSGVLPGGKVVPLGGGSCQVQEAVAEHVVTSHLVPHSGPWMTHDSRSYVTYVWRPSVESDRMPQLIAPKTLLRDSWLASRDEWGRGVHRAGAGVGAVDEVGTPEDFSVVQKLCLQSDPSIPAKVGRVHATYWWIVEDETFWVRFPSGIR